MEYRQINVTQMDALWTLHRAYKQEIGEELPTGQDKAQLTAAVNAGSISFYGAGDGEILVGCCSITVGFSTFNYAASGVLEDFYIRPDHRHQGIARALVRYAYDHSGASSLTVGCADCDVAMYGALGFTIPLGNLLAYE